jgi:hypothetical protein
LRVPAVATSEPHECWIAARVPALGLKRSGFEARDDARTNRRYSSLFE